jgi:hypothetical protein
VARQPCGVPLTCEALHACPFHRKGGANANARDARRGEALVHGARRKAISPLPLVWDERQRSLRSEGDDTYFIATASVVSGSPTFLQKAAKRGSAR